MNRHSHRPISEADRRLMTSAPIVAAKAAPSADRLFSPEAHAQYGHRLGQFSLSAPVLQRQSETEDDLQRKPNAASAPLQREAEDEVGTAD